MQAFQRVDADLDRMLDYVIEELGVPKEDALEVANRRLGRVPKGRRARPPTMVELLALEPTGPKAVALTLGNAKTTIKVSR